MREGLQTSEIGYFETGTPIRESTLILDGAYTSKVMEFLKDVHSEIRICAYAWRWYPSNPEIGIQKFNIALLRAAQRGIQIRLLVDTEAQKAAFRALGFDARCVVNTRMLHTKAICIDQKTLIIGSHNLTKRANSDNYEMSIATQEHQVVVQFIDYFDRLWLSRG